MRRMTNEGLALIKRFEGFSTKPYLCPAGWWTIGWGAIHGLDGQPVSATTPPVTEEEAETLLRRDVVVAERAVLRLISVTLTDGQFDALASFAFNLGGGALQRCTLRRKVNRQEHDDVPDEFRKWIWGGGRKLPGLVRRREAEAVMYVEAIMR